MDPLELHTHSFIVKIWREQTGAGADQVTWRGHITHVPSGERAYLKNLDDIADFIAPYLERIGVQLELNWRMRRWLNRWKHQLTRRK